MLDENITVEGSGQPIVFLHGVGLDRQMWTPVITQLKNRYQCITCDMIGHGNARMPFGPIDLKAFSEDLVDTIKSVVPPRPTLVGFSMGAMVAQRLALDHPDLIGSLVLSNAVFKRNKFQRAAILERADKVNEEGMSQMVEPAILRWFSPEFIDRNPVEINKIRATLLNNDLSHYIRAYRVFSTADIELAESIESIRCWATIVTGRNDINSTPLMAQEMSDKMTNSKVIIMNGVAHGAPIEAPKEFGKIVADAMESA